MRANAEAIDAMALLVQTEYRLFVDIVRRHNRQLAKPRHGELSSHHIECVPGQHRQIRQITGIDANADGPIALIVERQRHSTEIHKATSVGWKVGGKQIVL